MLFQRVLTSSVGIDIVYSSWRYVESEGEAMKIIENKKLRIVNVDNPSHLAAKALDIFVDSAQEAISTKDVFYVAIPGGQTPREFFELISRTEKAKSLPWNNIQLFWVDERCVDIDSKDCNYKLAAETFLSEILIPAQNIHRIHGESSDYIEAAGDYEKTIRNIFSLELESYEHLNQQGQILT